MKNTIKSVILGISIAMLSIPGANANEHGPDSLLDISYSEYKTVSYNMLDPENWKIFELGEQGGQDGVEYSYFYNKSDRSYLGVMHYLSSTSVENLLIGALYRADKENWTINSHTEFKMGNAIGYRLDYETQKNSKESTINITYLLDSDEKTYMIMFTVDKKMYKENIYSDLVARFNSKS
jgi:hypothetical protein